jgi:hypothetical protein
VLTATGAVNNFIATGKASQIYLAMESGGVPNANGRRESAQLCSRRISEQTAWRCRESESRDRLARMQTPRGPHVRPAGTFK